MSSKKIVLTKEKPKRVIPVNKDKPFIQVTKVVSLDDKLIWTQELISQIKITRIKKEGLLEESNLHYNPINHDPNSCEILINYLINKDFDSDFDMIQYECKNEKLLHKGIELHIQTTNNFVKMAPTVETFKSHLTIKHNTKLLFSAPFGQGKTTFLKYFFKNHENNYESFHLFPVNYSVQSNKDIFQLIKCELLFELLGRDVKFDDLDSAPDSLMGFSLKYGHELLAQFIKLIPVVGRSLYDIHEKVLKLAVKYDAQQNTLVNDKKLAQDYLSEFFESEGSIMEDNFYTQLIRQLLEQLGERKKTVLILDDLDRIDPEHLFRILNVFAAHFDSSNYDDVGNKFGFDKIILVCDIDNLRSIFHHRYGEHTHFEGFVNKFYSSHVFHFNNTKECQFLIEEVWKGQMSRRSKSRYSIILRDLILLSELSLREMLGLIKRNDFSNAKVYDNPDDISTVLWLLTDHFGFHAVQTKLNNIQSKKAQLSNNKELEYYNEFAFECMIELANSVGQNRLHYRYKEVSILFEGAMSLNPSLFDVKIKMDNHPYTLGRKTKYSAKDFYILLNEVLNSLR